MSISFPKTEAEVLKLWDEIDAFKTQLRLTEDGPRFTFYDGPPFATGTPHYGHLLASTIKDIIPRYWSMKGYHVVRRFGWDTHGVPIEFEIDKKLGIKGKEDVMKMGIANYNAECRSIVMTYADVWRQVIGRLGRWIDFDNDYKTLDTNYMESCWWVFKTLFDQGDVYRSYKIMPFSTALSTPLSQMEAKENEKMTQDPAIVIAFPLVEESHQPNGPCSFLIWTTTPWTLPSNLLIGAHPDLEYVEVKDEKTGNQYIMHENGLAMVLKDLKKAKYKILRKMKGKDMAGWKYKPIFDYFAEAYSDCFQIVNADYVEAGDGVGLVHMAPAFGEEDYDAAKAAGFITPERLPPCPVNDQGEFTAEVPDYEGLHVKTAAEKPILKHLRGTGRMIVESTVMHTDKFCWRSDTQLIRKAVSSWFIRIPDSIPQMLENLQQTNWVPQTIRDRRFKEWLSNSPDWSVSRNRYWGTPLPLWVSEDYEEVVCIGSIEELERLSGRTGITDIHRDKIDDITIPSKQGKGQLRRIEEVFDCWFESGSMPYASNHYPFEGKEEFTKDAFPADFIAEGLDQTRGWFYTLTVLGNKLFKTSPFKNVIVNGIVLAGDGKKMSKRLKNYPDPTHIFDQFGADALRLYLINSPVVRADPLRFKEEGVKELITRVLLPLWNSYRFFSEQVALFEKNNGGTFKVDGRFADKAPKNTLDRWILAECQSVLKYMEKEMAAYRLYTVVPRLLHAIDDLTNWYIRFNRKRLKGVAGLGLEDTTDALNTLFEVLFTLVRTLAPFMPFLTDHIYGLLRKYLPDETLATFPDSRSVHFLRIPEVREALFDDVIERQVKAMQSVIDLGRKIRDRRTLALKLPVLSMVVISDSQKLADIESLKTYVEDELNVRNVILTTDEDKYNIRLEAKVDWPTLGKKLKKDVQKVKKALPSLTQEQLRNFLKEKTIAVDGITLGADDLLIVRSLDAKSAKTADGQDWEAAFTDEVVVIIDCASHPELVDEGLARDLVMRIQKLRKRAKLVPTDDVRMEYKVVTNPDAVDVEGVIRAQEKLFVNALRGGVQPIKEDDAAESTLVEEEQEIGNLTVLLRLAKL